MIRSKGFISLVFSLMLLQLLGEGVHGLVLCVGNDGHIQIETTTVACCNPIPNPNDGMDWPPVNSVTMDAESSECTDIPIHINDLNDDVLLSRTVRPGSFITPITPIIPQLNFSVNMVAENLSSQPPPKSPISSNTLKSVVLQI